MLRAFVFAIIAFLLLALAWFVAALPGHVTVDIAGYIATASTAVAIVLLVIFAAIVVFIIAILGALLRTPRRIGARRALVSRDKGDAASLRALSALAAGDPAGAAGHARTASRHAPDAPLTLFVQGETARRNGDHRTADARFTALAQNKDAAFLGWQGLLRHRTRPDADQRQLAEASTQARAAAMAYPNSVWLRDRRVQLATNLGSYADAARLATDKRARAALAIMASREAASTTLAIDWAREAVRDAPSLPMAHLALVKARERAGQSWRMKRAIRNGWKAAPHPDLAEAWLAPIVMPLDRARAAQTLAATNPGHPESEALLARTAAAADLSGEAQRHAELAAGAAGSAWVCQECDMNHPEWQATCRKCGTIGSLAWVRGESDPITVRLSPPSPPAAGAVAVS